MQRLYSPIASDLIHECSVELTISTIAELTWCFFMFQMKIQIDFGFFSALFQGTECLVCTLSLVFIYVFFYLLSTVFAPLNFNQMTNCQQKKKRFHYSEWTDCFSYTLNHGVSRWRSVFITVSQYWLCQVKCLTHATFKQLFHHL